MRTCPFLLPVPSFRCREKAIARDRRRILQRSVRLEFPEAATKKANAHLASTSPASHTIAAATSARRSGSAWPERREVARDDRTPQGGPLRAQVQYRACAQAATQQHARICRRRSREIIHR